VSAGCANCYMYRDKKRFGQDPATVIRSKPRTFSFPLRLKEPGVVFVCSWSDFFIEDADEWRSDAWEIMRKTPHLTYQLLTKRPENIKERLPEDWPLKNVWLGVTAENQEQADYRIPALQEIPAALRFVSVEPMLERVVIHNHTGLSWVICGGESGYGFRPMEERWAESLLHQCCAMGTLFFMKQMAGKKPIPEHLQCRELPISI